MLETFSSGGLLMIPISVASVTALAICAERAWFLQRGRVLPAGTVNQFKQLLEKKGFSDEDFQMLASSCLLGQVFFEGLKKAKLGKDEMKEAMGASVTQSSYLLEKYLTTLGVIAAVCPLLGLLGTVIGMIDVFATINETGARNSFLLAGGISTALVTTAAGLIIAIPSLVMHRVFVRRVDEFVSEMDNQSIKFIDLIESMR